MTTRCMIQIEGVKYAEIYKHYDGMPSEILEKLKDFNEDFNEFRHDDPEYKFAQLLRASKEMFDDHAKYSGWGVYAWKQMRDVNYIYLLKKDGSVVIVDESKW